MSAQIHPTAIVAKGAELGEGVIIGPYCIVGEKVKLGKGVTLHSHVVVEGDTTVGEGTEVFPFAVLGTKPQDLKFKGEASRLEIGARNKIREHVTMNPGTEGGGLLTKVGDDCLFMVNTHVAHDCVVGNHVIMANNATLAGHVTVGDWALLGGLSAVLQFVRVGAHAMVGGLAGVESDVIPYGLVKGERATLYGLNLIGMQRRGFKTDDINAAREAFREIFRSQGTLSERMAAADVDYGANPVVGEMLKFMHNKSKHGICQPKLEDAA